MPLFTSLLVSLASIWIRLLLTVTTDRKIYWNLEFQVRCLWRIKYEDWEEDFVSGNLTKRSFQNDVHISHIKDIWKNYIVSVWDWSNLPMLPLDLFHFISLFLSILCISEYGKLKYCFSFKELITWVRFSLCLWIFN